MGIGQDRIQDSLKQRARIFLSKYVNIHFINCVKFVRHFGLNHIWDLKNPYYFIHLPKCAGKSIRLYLIEHKIASLVIGHAIHHVGFKFPFKRLKKFDNRAFCVVRNPFERIASAYFFLKGGGKNKTDAKIFEHYMFHYGEFSEFVLKGLGNNEKLPDLMEVAHLIPLTNYITDDDGDLCVAPEHILRFESLAEDFSRYIRSRGFKPGKLPWEHRTSRGYQYADLYRMEDGTIHQEMVDVIVQLYQKDFEVFGYAKSLS